MNKMIKKIKNMKMFKKKTKSYEKDINSGMVNIMDGRHCGHRYGHRRDLDFVKTSTMNYDDVNNMNVNHLNN